ncbi:Polyketide synthase family protein (fragment) [Frankia canadensis]|uniref:Polyketide synthase family protein n=2 Tax=Frankia canadensis TaxID=1836972 RepID=A0A2I2KVV6_9ACTN
MIAIRASADDVTASLVGQDGRVEIAAVNGPAAVVIAGDADAAERIAAGWASRGHATRRLTVSHAFHSPHMDGMLARFRQVVGGVDYRRPAVPVVSTLTGATDEAELCSPDHWVRQARGPVRFLDAVHHLAAAERADTFVELGPDAVLTALLADCLPAVSAQPPSARPHAPETVAVATARAHRPEPDVLLATLATLDVHGVDVDWRAVLGPAGRLVDLPTYPFQRRRHWLSPPSPTPAPGPEPATESGTAAAAAGPEPTSGAGGWWYRPVWRRLDAADVTAAVAAQAGPTPPLGGHWAVLVPPAGVGGALVERVSWLVERLGGVPVPVMLASADRRAIAERLTTEGFTAAGPPVGGLVSLLALDTSPCADHPGLGTGLALTVALAQALADLRVEAPLWAITTGAVPTGPADPVTCPEQAMIWGLGRTLALEAPRTWGGLIDVPLDRAGGLADELRAPDDQSLLWLGVALTAPGGEDQFAVRPDGLWVARLRAEDGPGGAPAGRRWSPAGTVLITGGTGALGGQIARELARGGTDRLVLVGRRGPDTAGARELVGELAALGARATVAACDVGDADQFTALLDQLAAGGEPVTAVVHAAGVAGPSAPLERLDLAAFADVLAAKATGAAVLGRLLADPHTALREVVLVSSIAAVWGSGGQAAYSAANAYLDALAATRTVTGRRLTAVAFGPWADAGIGAEPALRDFLTRRGLRPLDPPSAAGALTHAVAARHPASVVVDVDWARFLPAITAARPSRYFEELALPPTPRSDPSGVGGATAAPPTLPAPRSGAEYADLVRAQAAAVLGHDTPADVDPRRRFLELGFDSLASVELRRRLAAATGLPLGTQAVFEHPTVADLAAHLRSIAADRGDQPDATPSPRPTTSTGAVGDAGGDDGVELAGGVRWLYRQACAQGRFAAGVGVLRAAARLRPVFRTAGEFGTPPRLVRLATGPAPFVLVCLPSLVAPSGPHNFARLALHLHGRRDVHALAHPGFGDGELLPASADLVIGMHADAVARAFPGRPAVLAGYSSGGWLAHATAAALEERGVRPAAVALLDTWLPTDQIPEEDIHEELRGIAVNDQAFALMTEAQVTAQGAYLDLFEHWRPRQVEAPVMLVRAARRMPRRVVAEDVTGPDQAWTTDWEMGHDSFDVAGDHQSMMHEHAETTARDVDRWLRGLEARDGHPARDHDRDGGAGRPAAGVGRLPARPSV